MNLSGHEHFEASPETVWDQVTNLEFTANTLPGLERVDKLEPTRLECRVKPSFSFLTGGLKMIFEILETDRPRSARMRITGKGIAASIVIETSLHLSPEGTGTRLEWQSEVTELTGLLKAVSRGLIEGAAQKIVQDSWSVFRKHLDGPAG
jgi:2-furoyl-CoA dehydrogenase large subunit